MFSMHSVLIFHRGGFTQFPFKEFRKRLFFAFLGFIFFISSVSTVKLFLKQREVNNEIASLNAEHDHKIHELVRLKEVYSGLSQIILEQRNIRRIVTAVNPRLEHDAVNLWVKTVRHNADGVFQSLNEQSRLKLNSPEIQYSLDTGVSLLLAIGAVESDFNLDTRSRKGAYGPMQLRTVTANYIGVLDPRNPEDNINGGARYLCELFTKYHAYPDQLELGLASYNAGKTRVMKEWIPNWGSRWQNINEGLVLNGGAFKETRNYVNSILALSHLFVSGQWNTRNRYFWSNYKSYTRKFDLAFLYYHTTDSENSQ